MSTAYRCSAASLRSGEPAVGTASTVRRFLLVEEAGPWGVDAVPDSRLPERVKAHLIALRDRNRIRPLLIDPEAARRIHGLLRSEIARAELTAALPALDERRRGQVSELLEELDRPEPSERFAAIVSDPELERRLFALSGRMAAQQGRAGTSMFATLSTLRVVEVKRLSQELADRWGAALTTVFVVFSLTSPAASAFCTSAADFSRRGFLPRAHVTSTTCQSGV